MGKLDRGGPIVPVRCVVVEMGLQKVIELARSGLVADQFNIFSSLGYEGRRLHVDNRRCLSTADGSGPVVVKWFVMLIMWA